MKVGTTTISGRKAWFLDNDAIIVTMTQGGGHIASLELRDRKGINPMWTPVWKSLEPWQYNAAKHKAKYELKLLASIMGHNICLGWFGDPSPDEARAGMEVHGEAPVAKWKLASRKVTRASVSMTCTCDLPVSQMQLTRTVSASRASRIVSVKETVRNTSKRDLPFTMCQHVTMGPPFLEKGVTVFDMPATKCHTFPGAFSKKMRFKQDTAFRWPDGPGAKGGKVDMRVIGREYKASSDFTTQLMDPARDDAWFSAVNPKQGLMLAYVWRREDFPWVGNWEENRGRNVNPWAGKSLTRGMEFANTPFPIGLRNAVDMSEFHDMPTYRWLPAAGKVEVEYDIIMAAVPARVKGVKNISKTETGFQIDLVS